MKSFLAFMAVLWVLLGPMSLPAQADPTIEKALSEFYQKNYTDAFTDFSQLAESDPKNCFALVMWLECAHRLSTIGNVVTTLEGRVQKAPQDAKVLGQLALAYMYQSSEKYSAVTSGQEAFDKALSLDPNCSTAHTGLGLYYFTSDKIAKAKNQLTKAVEVYPGDFIAKERLGEIMLTGDDKPELAIPKFKELVAALPTYPDAYFFLAMAQEKSKKLKEATSNYEKAIQLDPFALTRSVYARVRVARLYEDAHHKDLALHVLQDLVVLRPDFKEGKTELTELQNGTQSNAQTGK